MGDDEADSFIDFGEFATALSYGTSERSLLATRRLASCCESASYFIDGLGVAGAYFMRFIVRYDLYGAIAGFRVEG